jgi:hypothetical protein
MMTREQWEKLAEGSNYYEFAKVVINELTTNYGIGKVHLSKIAIQQLAVAMYAARHIVDEEMEND